MNEVEIIIKNPKISEKKFNEQFFNDVDKAFSDFIKNKGTNLSNRIYLSSIEHLHKCLSTKRLELLQTIRHKKPKSVYELAKMTNREFEPVKRDVKLLIDSNFLEVKQNPKGRKNKILTCKIKKVTIDI